MLKKIYVKKKKRKERKLPICSSSECELTEHLLILVCTVIQLILWL